MPYLEINWLAILLATIASMGLGMGWYMVLSKQWLEASGRTMEDVRQDGGNPMPFIWAAAAQLIMAYFLALLTPMVMGSVTLANTLILAVHLWFGFVLTSMVLNHRYQGRPWSLTVIDGGYLLGVAIVQAVVIGLFG